MEMHNSEFALFNWPIVAFPPQENHQNMFPLELYFWQDEKINWNSN